MNKLLTNRRKLLKGTLMSLGGISLATGTTKAALQSCGLTPAQTEGPFYPVEDQLDKDSDLTFVKHKRKSAKGEVIILKGVVRDQNCKVIKDTLVEIWQACSTGKYNHPGDPNPAKLDPNFQYWGRSLTNDKGEYSFKTVIPGFYQATSNWMRPAHIHLKVHRRGFEELTSQVYFKGDPYNKSDKILQSLTKEEQSKVIVNFEVRKDKTGFEKDNIKIGNFDITIRNI